MIGLSDIFGLYCRYRYKNSFPLPWHIICLCFLVFKGMPAVWAQHLPSGLTREEVHVDGAAGKEIAPSAPQRHVKRALANKGDDSSAKAYISKPFNFQHKFHVKMDQRASTGFTVSWIASQIFLILTRSVLWLTTVPCARRVFLQNGGQCSKRLA